MKELDDAIKKIKDAIKAVDTLENKRPNKYCTWSQDHLDRSMFGMNELRMDLIRRGEYGKNKTIN